MSAVKLVSAGLIVAAAVQLGINTALPQLPPIVITALSFEGGEVIQERTITPPDGMTAIPMTWVAEVQDTVTGLDVPGCHGSGVNVYQAGTRAAHYPLPEWVGNQACTIDRLVPGRLYVLQAAWVSDAATVMFESEPVELRPE